MDTPLTKHKPHIHACSRAQYCGPAAHKYMDAFLPILAIALERSMPPTPGGAKVCPPAPCFVYMGCLWCQIWVVYSVSTRLSFFLLLTHGLVHPPARVCACTPTGRQRRGGGR